MTSKLRFGQHLHVSSETLTGVPWMNTTKLCNTLYRVSLFGPYDIKTSNNLIDRFKSISHSNNVIVPKDVCLLLLAHVNLHKTYFREMSRITEKDYNLSCWKNLLKLRKITLFFALRILKSKNKYDVVIGKHMNIIDISIIAHSVVYLLTNGFYSLNNKRNIFELLTDVSTMDTNSDINDSVSHGVVELDKYVTRILGNEFAKEVISLLKHMTSRQLSMVAPYCSIKGLNCFKEWRDATYSFFDAHDSNHSFLPITLSALIKGIINYFYKTDYHSLSSSDNCELDLYGYLKLIGMIFDRIQIEKLDVRTLALMTRDISLLLYDLDLSGISINNNLRSNYLSLLEQLTRMPSSNIRCFRTISILLSGHLPVPFLESVVLSIFCDMLSHRNEKIGRQLKLCELEYLIPILEGLVCIVRNGDAKDTTKIYDLLESYFITSQHKFAFNLYEITRIHMALKAMDIQRLTGTLLSCFIDFYSTEELIICLPHLREIEGFHWLTILSSLKIKIMIKDVAINDALTSCLSNLLQTPLLIPDATSATEMIKEILNYLGSKTI